MNALDNPETQANFQAAAIDLMSQYDMPLDPNTVSLDYSSKQLDVYGHSPDAQIYCQVRAKQTLLTYPHIRPPKRLETPTDLEPYTLGGLLTAREGHLKPPKPAARTLGRMLLSVSVTSDPSRYNEVAHQLGRTPGQDALEVIICDEGEGELPVGIISRNWASWKRTTSAISHPLAMHDLKPEVHQVSFMSLHPTDLETSVLHVQDLIAIPEISATLDNPISKGHPRLEEFCRGTEGLQGLITGQLLQRIHKCAQSNEHPEAVTKLINYLTATEVTRINLRQLGILDASAGNAEAKDATHDVLLRIAANITQMLITAEEINPTPGLFARAHRRRIDALANIANHLAAESAMHTTLQRTNK